MNDRITTLFSIRETLKKVQVSGEENWDRMLGCVKMLTQIIHEMRNEDAGTDDNAS